MFSQRTAGDFYQTGSLAAGRSRFVPPLTPPVSTKRRRPHQKGLILSVVKVAEA